ncbi:MAG: co-chaperone GroES [Parachlamydiaceae bacterium]|nr:co-chaperone GroES [Parachlamydiaceae bacterium]
MTKIKPLGNRVLLKRSKAPTTKGGILLPDSAQKKPQEGVVIAVGPGKIDEHGKRDSMQVKEGDVVLFSAYSGTEVIGDDEELLIISEEEILGVMA